jgi:hypothetical protein
VRPRRAGAVATDTRVHDPPLRISWRALGAGALVAIDRRDRVVGAQLRVLQRQGTPLRASAAVVGQIWRDGRKQANLARVLAGVGIDPYENLLRPAVVAVV